MRHACGRSRFDLEAPSDLRGLGSVEQVGVRQLHDRASACAELLGEIRDRMRPRPELSLDAVRSEDDLAGFGWCERHGKVVWATSEGSWLRLSLSSQAPACNAERAQTSLSSSEAQAILAGSHGRDV
jgi:hypothetical protein